jgi:hypothetical protein
MKQIAVLTAIVTASMVAGCATPPKTTQEEDMEILKSQVVMLHATLTTCNAALAKDGLRVVLPGDTLAKTAKDNGIDVKELLRMNPEMKFGQPQSWRPGIVIRVRERKPNNGTEPIR